MLPNWKRCWKNGKKPSVETGGTPLPLLPAGAAEKENGMKETPKRKNAAPPVLILLVALVLCAAAAGLCLGSQPYTLPQLWQATRSGI